MKTTERIKKCPVRITIAFLLSFLAQDALAGELGNCVAAEVTDTSVVGVRMKFTNRCNVPIYLSACVYNTVNTDHKVKFLGPLQAVSQDFIINNYGTPGYRMMLSTTKFFSRSETCPK